MKILVTTTLLLFLAVPALGDGTVMTKTFESPALGVEKAYRIYLPDGYHTDGRRYPVIYLLHGLGVTEKVWTAPSQDPQGAADAIILQAIVVMPDGERGYYANSLTSTTSGVNRYSADLSGMFGGHLLFEPIGLNNPWLPAFFAPDQLSLDGINFGLAGLIAADQITDILAVIGKITALDLRLEFLAPIISSQRSITTHPIRPRKLPVSGAAWPVSYSESMISCG